MLPLGGVLIALFAGWFMSERAVREEMDMQHPWLYRLWYFLLRFVTPICVIAVFLKAINVI